MTQLADDFAISVRSISKRYRLGRNLNGRGWWNRKKKGDREESDFWALKDVSFDLGQGERLGIIGRNGSGKSTLLKILARLIYPTEGEAVVRGRVAALLEVGTGMNELLSGRRNIELMGAIRGMKQKEIADRMDEIIDFSGLGDFIEEPIRNYSSGMRSRLAFSVTAHLDPDVLILDEVLSVGDMAFTRKCLGEIERLTSTGRTVIFVSHSINQVMKFCERGIWLEHGSIVMDASVQEVAEAYSTSMMNLVAETPPQPKPSRPVPARPEDPSIPDPGRPGAEFVAFRIIDQEGRLKTTFTRRERIRLELRFRVFRFDLEFVPTVHVIKEGVNVFSLHPPKPMKIVTNQVHEATVEIPAKLLNAAIYHFTAEIVTPSQPILKHATLHEAVSCSIFDQISGQEIFAGDYRGVVRLQLPWKVAEHQ